MQGLGDLRKKVTGWVKGYDHPLEMSTAVCLLYHAIIACRGKRPHLAGIKKPLPKGVQSQ